MSTWTFVQQIYFFTCIGVEIARPVDLQRSLVQLFIARFR